MNLNMLSAHQKPPAERALAVESGKRRHIVVYVSGAHAYGFPSPDSDVDLKCVHIVPTRRLVGLAAPKQAADRFEIIDEVEIDYTSNELGPVISGIIAGNGNYIERVLGHCCAIDSPELHELRPLVRDVLSRKVYRHYSGFARNQLSLAFKGERVAAKKVLYVLRTGLTGIHLLRTRELVTDINELLDDYDLGDARELIERKRAGERVDLDPDTAERWRGRLADILDQLTAVRAESPLPEEPENVDTLADWLLSVRKANW